MHPPTGYMKRFKPVNFTLLSVHAYSLCVGVMYSDVNHLEVYIQSAGTYIQSAGIEFLVPKVYADRT